MGCPGLPRRSGRPRLCTWASLPSRPWRGTGQRASRAVVPARRPHLRAARRGPAPPPPVLTPTLAHPAAAGPRVGLAACPRGRGSRSPHFFPSPRLLPFTRHPPIPDAWAASPSPSPQPCPRVSSAGSSGRGLPDALAPARPLGARTLRAPAAEGAGPVGRNLKGGAGRSEQDRLGWSLRQHLNSSALVRYVPSTGFHPFHPFTGC